MIAYKLLRPGRIAPFSGLQWPPPGEWLEADEVDPCRAGIHACRVGDLPLWLGLGELWEVELDGDVVEQERKVVARRGRLLRRVEEWDDAANRAFLEACAAEARRRTDAAPAQTEYADDIAHGAAIAPVAGYMAARLAEVQDGPAGYEQERRRQADWLGANLRLRT